MVRAVRALVAVSIRVPDLHSLDVSAYKKNSDDLFHRSSDAQRQERQQILDTSLDYMRCRYARCMFRRHIATIGRFSSTRTGCQELVAKIRCGLVAPKPTKIEWRCFRFRFLFGKAQRKNPRICYRFGVVHGVLSPWQTEPPFFFISAHQATSSSGCSPRHTISRRRQPFCRHNSAASVEGRRVPDLPRWC